MDRDNTLIEILKSTLFSLISFIALSLILILLSPPLLLLLKDPSGAVPFVATGILIASSIVGGTVCAYLSKNPFYSLIPALAAILILLLGSAFYKDSSLSFAAALGSYIAVPAAFLGGGFIMHLLSNRRPKRRKRR